jgi:hypothetical protein
MDVSIVGKKKHLPLIAHAFLLPLCTFSLGAGYLVPDRGKDFQAIYVATAGWADRSFQRPLGAIVTNLNHPLMMLAAWPFVSLPYQAALHWWTTCSILATCIATVLIARETRLPALDVTLLTISATGTLIAFSLGQVTPLLMVLFTVAWVADRNGSPMIAGGCLGALCLLKPFYGLFVLYLAWRGEWRGLITCAVTGCIGTAVGFAMVGERGLREWISNLQSVGWQSHLYNGSVWGIGNRLFTETADPWAASWTPLFVAPRVAFMFGLSASAACLLWLWRCRRRTDLDQQYALLGLGCLIVSPLGWIYYLAVGLGPVLAVLARRPSRWFWLIGALAMLPYTLLSNHEYGRLGTLFVGQWAFLIFVSLATAVALSPERSVRL